MNNGTSGAVTRRALIGGLSAATLITAAAPATAFGFLRKKGNFRSLRMYSSRTGESINTVYAADGRYIPEAIDEISHFMRDWRNGQVKRVDPRTIDIIARAHRLLDTDEPYMLLSGYRSPETNTMLRRRSSGVAKNSLHLQAKAADLHLKSRSIDQMFRAAQRVKGGGVGKYSRSDFVHMDSGHVRYWGR